MDGLRYLVPLLLLRTAPATPATPESSGGRIRRRNRAETAARQSRDVLLRAMAERDPALHAHTLDVAGLAHRVARALGMEHEACDEVARAAELHDVGKVAIPDLVLRKPGPLNEAEEAVMRRHAVIGAAIVASAPALKGAAALVRASHERWDGRGYPDGLAGAAIPLGARIVAVCDAYSAMRQARCYGPVLSDAEARAELRRCAGTQFDPDVVEAFCAHVLATAAAAAA